MRAWARRGARPSASPTEWCGFPWGSRMWTTFSTTWIRRSTQFRPLISLRTPIETWGARASCFRKLLVDEHKQSREWNSAVYHQLSTPQVTWGKKVLSRLHLRGDEFVLDAGCGTGRLTADLLEALPRGRVVGIDLSQNMLGSARKHLAQFSERVTLLACDFLYLPFEHAFDGIVS